MKSPITTHILDTSLGCPAANVKVHLEREDGTDLVPLAEGTTDHDGRIGDLIENGSLQPGTYQIRFDTQSYFDAQNRDCFYPSVTIRFSVKQTDEHYHVPLLLNPFGYSTYRGS